LDAELLQISSYTATLTHLLVGSPVFHWQNVLFGRESRTKPCWWEILQL
jgi:hypothetical protein